MVVKNVCYAAMPDEVIVKQRGIRAVVEIPENVTEITYERDGEDVTEYVAEKVYCINTQYTKNLRERVLADKEAWKEVARQIAPVDTTLADVVEAINALTEIVLGE